MKFYVKKGEFFFDSPFLFAFVRFLQTIPFYYFCRRMKPTILIDKNIPFIQGILEPFADVEYLDASDFTSKKIRMADALIIRTRTRCNKSLLQNSNVKLIVSATIGFDHIDTDFCERNGIKWYNTPGCNATSVAQYIASVFAFLK